MGKYFISKKFDASLKLMLGSNEKISKKILDKVRDLPKVMLEQAKEMLEKGRSAKEKKVEFVDENGCTTIVYDALGLSIMHSEKNSGAKFELHMASARTLLEEIADLKTKDDFAKIGYYHETVLDENKVQKEFHCNYMMKKMLDSYYVTLKADKESRKELGIVVSNNKYPIELPNYFKKEEIVEVIGELKNQEIEA